MRASAIVILLMVFVSCDKENTQPDKDWLTFKTGVIQKDRLLIDQELSRYLINTSPKPTESDPIGQKINIDNLVNAINNSQLLEANTLCYACIETNPAQTEITISTDSSGVSISRIIDISTPDDDILKFSNIHDSYN